MSKKESYRRHSLIISKLKRSPLNFQELQDYLRTEGELMSEKLDCSLRTFQRELKEIASLYDIEIIYDRSAKVYKIAYDGREEHNERLIETFELFNALKLANNFSGQLFLENRKSSGTEHLYGLLHAIKNRFKIEFTYCKFYNNETSERSVAPIAIKEAKNRWYLLAEEEELVKSFGLDRISNLRITKNKFEPIEYKTEDEYKHSFGIINGTGEKPEKVILSFNPTAAKFIKSLALHHSQKLIFESDIEVHFEYFIRPTHDFVMEILSHGESVKVLQPKNLQRKLVEKLHNALANY